MVSVLLSPGLTPDAELDTGDEVMVIRTSTEAGGSGEAITEGLVVRKSAASETTSAVPAPAASRSWCRRRRPSRSWTRPGTTAPDSR